MTSKEALETLGNVEVAVTTIRSGITHFKTLKEQYETEFEVLERELFIRKELKDFDVYQRQLEKLEKENQELKEKLELALDKAIEKCMKFDKCPPITCIELYNGNNNVCKECWKKYFMKEVLENVD